MLELCKVSRNIIIISIEALEFCNLQISISQFKEKSLPQGLVVIEKNFWKFEAEGQE